MKLDAALCKASLLALRRKTYKDRTLLHVEVLHISRKTLRAIIRKKLITFFYLPGTKLRRISKASVIEYLKACIKMNNPKMNVKAGRR